MLNYLIVCFTQCTLFFQYVWFLLTICLPCIISFCGAYVPGNEDKCCVVTHGVADVLVTSLLAWLVYLACLCSYVLPIATLNQNKRSLLLYLGNAQIINSATTTTSTLVCLLPWSSEKKRKGFEFCFIYIVYSVGRTNLLSPCLRPKIKG